MSKVSVLTQVTICPVCHKAYIPETDICECPETPKDPQPGEGSNDDMDS